MPVKVIAMQGDLGAAGQPFAHHYSVCVGAGRACEGLRADWQAQLCRAHRECGFEYVRFHGLLTDDMHVCYRDESGALRYSWQYVDSLFDALLAMGVRPFVEFGFCPAVLAGGTRTQFWWQGRVDPPADLDAWADLVGADCRHWVARYGAEEVRRWYFEIWNEPDLNAFWNGTRSQYFALYAASARAVKAADPALRVGGPATSNFVPDDRFDGEVEDTSRQLTAFAEDLDALARGLDRGVPGLLCRPSSAGGFCFRPSLPHRLGPGRARQHLQAHPQAPQPGGGRGVAAAGGGPQRLSPGRALPDRVELLPFQPGLLPR